MSYSGTRQSKVEKKEEEIKKQDKSKHQPKTLRRKTILKNKNALKFARKKQILRINIGKDGSRIKNYIMNKLFEVGT